MSTAYFFSRLTFSSATGIPHLYFHVGIDILPVLLCFVPVLYGKFGAAVKTSETHNALILYPHGFHIRYSNGVHRALFLTQAATYATVFYGEICGFACFVVINRA